MMSLNSPIGLSNFKVHVPSVVRAKHISKEVNTHVSSLLVKVDTL